MAQVIFDIPNAQLTRVLNGYATRHGYTGTHNGSAETKQAFLKRKLIEHVMEGIRSTEEATSVAAAIESTRQSVESGVTIT